MSYVDAISNALAARGNALSQGELQRGAVYGNLARNLGEIPGQAIAFHQQRQAALENSQLKKLAIEDAQREAELEKDLIQISNSGLPPDQIQAQIENRVSQDPKRFLEMQRFKSQREMQKYKLLEGQPGSVVPQGPLALPEPTRSTSVYGTGALSPGGGPVIQPEGMQNAFAPPQTEAAQRVHPEIPGLGAPPTDTQQFQQKVARIKTLGLDPETEKLAIESLVVPASILSAQARGSAAPGVGLGTLELVSPDGRQVITVQTTRTGHLIETGTGQLIDPARVEGWTKRHAYAPWIGIGQDLSPVVVNREEIGRRGLGTISGTVPDVKVAETLTPITTATGQITGKMGSKTGQVSPVSGGGAGGPESPIYKGALSEGAQGARAQIQVFQDSLNKIGPLVEKHKDVVGRVRGNVEKGLAWAGWSDDEVDDLIGEMNTVKNTYIYMVSGKQINEAEQARLSAVMPDIGLPPARLKNNLARFRRIVDTMAKARELGRVEGATPAELAAADPGSSSTVPAAGGETKVINGVTYKKVQGGWQKQKQ